MTPRRSALSIWPWLTVGSLAVLVAAAAAALNEPGSPRASSDANRPNIVMLMTDDQTVSDMRALPETRALIGRQGTKFANSFASYPLCCPSRATYLTGQYAHNHGVRSNGPPDGGFQAFRGQGTTFPVALQRAGYRTIQLGKYLNGYGAGPEGPKAVPPGWTDWRASVDFSTYHYWQYTLNENGQLHSFGEAEDDYQTDVYARMAASIIEDEAHTPGPFFLNVAFLAPHAIVGRPTGPPAARRPAGQNHLFRAPQPAVRDIGRFANARLPRPPSFNEADISDKPRFARKRSRLSGDTIADITANYRARLESLLAVDDAVRMIYDALRRTGQLGSTVIIFTSDNGFLLGEHRVPNGKVLVYEPSVRVPLLIRAPGFIHRATSRALVSNVDLAPTILELAGAGPLRKMDGRSLVPLLRNPRRRFRRDLLLESLGAGRIYSAVRQPRFVYVEYRDGERELYDLKRDPFELRNEAAYRSYRSVAAELRRRLQRLRDCRGRGCLADRTGGRRLPGDG